MHWVQNDQKATRKFKLINKTSIKRLSLVVNDLIAPEALQLKAFCDRDD